jgi:dolichol-phosphate mannosyltransferase
LQATLDLVVVMPVYNEAACIAGVLRSWIESLAALGIRFRLIALNDGSKDATRQELDLFSADDRVTVVNKENSGHGPTILQGYHMAVGLAPWVFQCDSDDEMRPEHFAGVWTQRKGVDAVFGIRGGRQQATDRRLISGVSRLLVRWLFGRGVTDVNVPYRLMRSCYLRQAIEQIPADTFAPNVIIAGAFARAGLRIANVPIPHESRKTGTVSIMKWKLWKAAGRAFRQTLFCRPRITLASSTEEADDGT